MRDSDRFEDGELYEIVPLSCLPFCLGSSVIRCECLLRASESVSSLCSLQIAYSGKVNCLTKVVSQNTVAAGPKFQEVVGGTAVFVSLMLLFVFVVVVCFVVVAACLFCCCLFCVVV